jgi:hypothetical protein
LPPPPRPGCRMPPSLLDMSFDISPDVGPRWSDRCYGVRGRQVWPPVSRGSYSRPAWPQVSRRGAASYGSAPACDSGLLNRQRSQDGAGSRNGEGTRETAPEVSTQ